jgi:RluA family pseudouridine synthase
MPQAIVDVLFEDGPVIVINKPGGVATQAPPGIDSLERRVREFLKARDGRPGNIYLGVPHRLDRPASGAIVFARHSRAARRLAEQFEGRLVQKMYWAIVEGLVQPATGTWIDHIRKVPDVAQAEIVAADHPEGREAVLHYRCLQEMLEVASGAAALLEITLETGRMHQIRIQSASRGHPVLGDAQYGAVLPFGPQETDLRLRWIALHARRLAFRHPMTREPVAVEAPLSECWRQWVTGAARHGQVGDLPHERG